MATTNPTDFLAIRTRNGPNFNPLLKLEEHRTKVSFPYSLACGSHKINKLLTLTCTPHTELFRTKASKSSSTGDSPEDKLRDADGEHGTVVIEEVAAKAKAKIEAEAEAPTQPKRKPGKPTPSDNEIYEEIFGPINKASEALSSRPEKLPNEERSLATHIQDAAILVVSVAWVALEAAVTTSVGGLAKLGSTAWNYMQAKRKKDEDNNEESFEKIADIVESVEKIAEEEYVVMQLSNKRKREEEDENVGEDDADAAANDFDDNFGPALRKFKRPMQLSNKRKHEEEDENVGEDDVDDAADDFDDIFGPALRKFKNPKQDAD